MRLNTKPKKLRPKTLTCILACGRQRPKTLTLHTSMWKTDTVSYVVSF